MKENLHQSIIHNLSLIPDEYLDQVNIFLSALKKKVEQKNQNRREILALAGAWSDMSEKDFKEHLQCCKSNI